MSRVKALLLPQPQQLFLTDKTLKHNQNLHQIQTPHQVRYVLLK